MCDTLIEHCDVVDKDNLKRFRSKRSEWLAWLNGDDPNSVWRQIQSMEWNHRIFLMINESRRISSQQSVNSAACNSLISEFVDQGYVAFQALAIRKQLDKKNNNKKKQIISIRRVVEEICDNRPLITRECFVGYDGLPFDYEPARQTFTDHLIEQRRNNHCIGNESDISIGSLPTAGPDAWASSQRRHKIFDQLANVGKDQRSRADEIHPYVFDFLNSHINRDKAPFVDVIEYVNKCIAHAGDETSLATLAGNQLGISIGKVEDCQKKLWQVSQFLISVVLYDTYIVPGINYQGNPLKGLEQPWLHAEKTSDLQDFWHTGYTSRDDWPDEFYREFTSHSELLKLAPSPPNAPPSPTSKSHHKPSASQALT